MFAGVFRMASAEVKWLESAAMNGLTTGDWLLLAAAAYLAVMSLARLMANHRNTIAAQLAVQIEEEQRAKESKDRGKAAAA